MLSATHCPSVRPSAPKKKKETKEESSPPTLHATWDRLDVGRVEHDANGGGEGLGGEVVAELCPDNTLVTCSSRAPVSFREFLLPASPA